MSRKTASSRLPPDADDASAGVYHGDGVASDDDAKVGDIAGIVGRGHGNLPEMHVDAIGHALDG